MNYKVLKTNDYLFVIRDDVFIVSHLPLNGLKTLEGIPMIPSLTDNLKFKKTNTMTTTERKRLYDAMMYALDEDGHTGDWKFKFINDYLNKVEAGQELTNVNRLEVINHAKNSHGIGRLLTMHKSMGDFSAIELDFQDDGKTLKIFIS